MNADELIQHYSALKRSEQRKFDRRYKSLQKFKFDIAYAATLVERHPDKTADEIAAMLRKR